MEYFKSATGKETLENHGFEIFDLGKNIEIVKNLSKDLSEVSKHVISSDVFRTKLGDIKQIQNLHNSKFPTEKIVEVFVNLLGINNYKVLNCQYFCKPPNYKMTSPHQDNAYFSTDSKVYTFWAPLQDVNILNSCMFYVPGSHKKGLISHKPIGTNTRTRTGKTGVSVYSDHYPNKSFVKVPLKLGQIVVHDKNTMHFSSPNLTDDYRYAFTAIIRKID